MKKSVLIIYTGGTIGMIRDPKTGVLCPFDFDQISDNVPEIGKFDFKIDSYALPQLIDSSNVKPQMWVELCNIIMKNYKKYDGFVILHGTDTMAYSASALSFMLRNLAKPIIFTGSQLPVGTIRTDGKENLIAALEIAAAYDGEQAIVPEVSILFGSKLFRGNRTTKFDAENFDAFESFNYPALAEIGIHINYNRKAINYSTSTDIHSDLESFTNLSTDIATLKIFPGITDEVVQTICNIKGMKGIILESYGSGNAPTDKKFIEIIKNAIDRGIIVYNVTQCLKGRVDMGRYETSRELLNIGVCSGYDITFEAAVSKMMYLIGRYENADEIKKQLKIGLKGELTKNDVGF
ncbi:MAG: type I asparaginase [Culturomica sp.]|jgi:L-asparaginase|nr:type I asparaginase [Culturomica sp.]